MSLSTAVTPRAVLRGRPSFAALGRAAMPCTVAGAQPIEGAAP